MHGDATARPATATGACKGARFELSQHFYFDAAHTLQRDVEREGSLRIHGHTYDARATVAGTPDPRTGMLMDLAVLKGEIARVRAMLDHRFLDEVPGLGPATLENLCSFIARELAPAVPALASVTVERRSSGDRCVMRLQG